MIGDGGEKATEIDVGELMTPWPSAEEPPRHQSRCHERHDQGRDHRQ